MPNFDKNTIPVAVNRHTRLDLSCQHVTTMNIGVAQPVYYRHMFKGETIDISSFNIIRPAPIQVPVYGRLTLNTRAFFVPWRIVFPQFDSFYTDTIGANADYTSLVSQGPCVGNDVIINMFTTFLWNGLPLVSVVSTPGDPYDLQLSGTKYAYTTMGRKFVKVLWSLGYRFIADSKDTTKVSLLPLLAYAKIYIDWYANQNYLDSNAILYIKKLLAFNDPTSYLSATYNDLGHLLGLVVDLVYPTSYFTGAWDNPVSPVSSQISTFSFTDPTVSNGAYVLTNGSSHTPEMFSGVVDSVGVSQIGTEYIHRALKLLTDYTRRNQLSGALEIDRWLSKFGVATDATRIQRSIYLGSQSTPIQIGDVTSTANTAGSGNMSNLGDYAGKGFGQGKSSWKFTSDEFGIIIVVASIMPSCGYYQGLDRNLLHIRKADFFQPEFDGLSTQAISRREVYVSKESSFGSASDYDGVFGFTGRYGEMKRPISWVTGDVSLDSVLQGGDAWHLMRKFNDANFGNSAVNINHSLDFTKTVDWEEYNRIFQYTGSDRDHFFVDFEFNVSSLAPCRPLFDTYDFEEFNKQVTIASNGSKMD